MEKCLYKKKKIGLCRFFFAFNKEWNKKKKNLMLLVGPEKVIKDTNIEKSYSY